MPGLSHASMGQSNISLLSSCHGPHSRTLIDVLESSQQESPAKLNVFAGVGRA